MHRSKIERRLGTPLLGLGCLILPCLGTAQIISKVDYVCENADGSRLEYGARVSEIFELSGKPVRKVELLYSKTIDSKLSYATGFVRLDSSKPSPSPDYLNTGVIPQGWPALTTPYWAGGLHRRVYDPQNGPGFEGVGQFYLDSAAGGSGKLRAYIFTLENKGNQALECTPAADQ